MKSEKMFDTQIKSALENIEVPYDPSTWSMLEQKLGPAPDQPHPVDTVVSDALSKMEVPEGGVLKLIKFFVLKKKHFVLHLCCHRRGGIGSIS